MNILAGTSGLIRLILRRDRFLLLLWIMLATLVVVGIAASVASAYPSAEARQAFAAESMSSPAEVLMIGPIYSTSIGGLAAWRVRGAAAIILAVASILTITRHTRTEEESGRRELLGSTVVGRHAPLLAALLVTLGANLLVAIFITGGLLGLGLPAAGSLALGLSLAAAGWVFAALAAVIAQVTESARAANGLALLIFGLSYMLRAIGDTGVPWLSWFSPFGWTQQMHPFAGEQWWPLAPVIVLVVVLVAAAYAFSAQRDLGAGFLQAKPGPATASPRLRSPLALAWRLQRGSLIAWMVASAAFGMALGGVGQSATNQVFAQFKDLFTRMGTPSQHVDSFFALSIYIASQVISIYAIQTALRLRSEEVNGQADPLLAVPISRLRWASSHLIIAAIGSALVLAALGLGIGLTYGLITGNVGYELLRLGSAALMRVFAVWVMISIAVALYGLLPRFALLVTYILLGLFLLIELLVEFHLVNPWLLAISPFILTPTLPASQLSITSVALLVLLIGVVAVLTSAGLVSFRHRDIG
ncbi:MAG: hypothetical protein J2P36_01710 [Ktedonobacteraceae bacterium]|nr:hypothetical protein [Ktedonobacteraceae bacterium]